MFLLDIYVFISPVLMPTLARDVKCYTVLLIRLTQVTDIECSQREKPEPAFQREGGLQLNANSFK
jgi:hypothetical protein